MSHEATNWALKQRGIKPAAKIVLWHLCDRYHPDHGCFPSQATLAHDCEMSRATVNRHLDELEAAGLIRRQQRIDPETKKQASTVYTFAFQFSVSQNDTRDGGAVSQNEAEPCLKNRDSRVSICDTNPVREPLIEPVNAREDALDLFSANSKDQKQPETGQQDQNCKDQEIERAFEQFWTEWPAHPRKAGKADSAKVFAAICAGKFAKGRATASQIVEAARAYRASLKGDFTYLKGPLPWLRQPGWEPFIAQAPGRKFSEDDLTVMQRTALEEGRVPPSMVGPDGKPNEAAQYWLGVFRRGAA